MCQQWLPILDKIFKFVFDYFPVSYSVPSPKSLALRLKRLIGLYMLVKNQMPGIACCFNHDSLLGWH